MKSIVLLMIILIASLCAAEKTYGNYIVDEVTSIYDGDTFTVNINSLDAIAGNRIPVRVSKIDTPEIKGKCKKEVFLARQAKEVTVAALRKAKKIELRNVKRGKYFRLVADVYVDGVLLSDLLKERGLAVPYFGEKKTVNWCR